MSTKFSKNCWSFSKLLSINSFIFVMNSSFFPKRIPFARFCKIFETKINFRCDSSSGDSAVNEIVHLYLSTSHRHEVQLLRDLKDVKGKQQSLQRKRRKTKEPNALYSD